MNRDIVSRYLEDFREQIAEPLGEAVDLSSLIPARFVCLDDSHTAQEIAAMLVDGHVTCILSRQDDGKLGIITQANIRSIPHGDWSVRALDIITPQVETVEWDDPVRVPLHEFQIDGKRHLPVVDEDGIVEQVLRPRSLVRAARKWQVLHDMGFFAEPAANLISSHDNRRRDRLRLPLGATIGDAIRLFIELKGAAIRLPEEGRVELIFTESDLMRAAKADCGPETPISEFASRISDDDPLPLTATVLEVANRMEQTDRRHILLGGGELVIIPRDIIQGIVDIDYPSVCTPRNTSHSVDGA